jgi:hypothetical protein
MISTSIRRQIRRLVVPQDTAGDRYPARVTVQPSSIPGGGYGVFYNDIGFIEPPMDDPDYNDIKVLCLYPGVYTPPLPLSVLMARQCDAQPVENLYLAKGISPSGVDFQNNAYVLNLTTEVGGYIDALALNRSARRPTCGPQQNECTPLIDGDGLRLDSSTSACGHLINHYKVGVGDYYCTTNVQVVPFWWKDMLLPEEDVDILSHWKLPNVLRCDNSPWYFDICTDQVVYFPSEEQQDSLHHIVAGAPITSLPIASGVNKNIPLEHGQEIFLDYELQPPFPHWAADWYRQ